jgi:DNA invertase Pin-like site-specific DNA recombinase
MDKLGKKHLRCAIYTRKSTEHNLDLEFNSLDAQREACEAYIKSQAHEGWRLTSERYDDGAYSGASLDRPALQELLREVRAGTIDVIAVYKVDRLTRSLADFAKLVELFEAYSVSFVSVTQSFNTTSSMGRLTLNMLLSFAQFEREVIGERVRDKIAASKRKGLWMGGQAPLGYRPVGKKLTIVPEEAGTVRLIFTRYCELGSIGALIEELDRRGIRTKALSLGDGRVRGQIRFGTGALAHLLKNRLYTGEVVYRGVAHRGEHEPIVGRELFEAVQAKLAANAIARKVRLKGSSALLTGRIFDDRGNRMSPTHSNKRGVRYRYYVSHALLQKQKAMAGAVARVPAPEIEVLVLNGVRQQIASREGEPATTDRELIERHVERVTIQSQGVEVHLVPRSGIGAVSSNGMVDGIHLPPEITLAWAAPSFVSVKGIVQAPSATVSMKPETRDALLTAIAKARAWIDGIRLGYLASFSEIAAHEGQGERRIRQLAPLAFLSPRIITAIAKGTAPADLTITGIAKALPYSWAEQERHVGLVRHDPANA